MTLACQLRTEHLHVPSVRLVGHLAWAGLGMPSDARRESGEAAREIGTVCGEIAHHHRVGLPVYRALKQGGGRVDPIMRTGALATLQRGEQMLAQAGVIARGMREGRMRALFERGPVLSLRCFNEAGALRSDDLDVMVAADDIVPASAILEGLGYRVMERRTGSGFESGLGRGSVLVAGDGSHFVDLAPPLSPRFTRDPFTFDELWGRRAEIQIGDGGLYAPAVVDAALLSARHGLKHAWQRLSWVIGFAGLTTGLSQEECEELLRRSLSARCGRAVLVATELSQRMLGAELPAEMQRAALMQPRVGELAAAYERVLISAATSEVHVPRRLVFATLDSVGDATRSACWQLAAGIRRRLRGRAR
jgi:hypothetical protein